MKRFILAVVFAFCCTLGLTPPAEAGLISKQQEIEMGRETAMQLEAKYGVVQDYALPGACQQDRAEPGQGQRTSGPGLYL